MSEELKALIITLLIATIPNVVIKISEKFKTKPEINKLSIEAADLSLDMLKDALCSCRDEITLTRAENKLLEEENKRLKMENKLLQDKIDSLGGKNVTL